jgi:hypothetical protein
MPSWELRSAAPTFLVDDVATTAEWYEKQLGFTASFAPKVPHTPMQVSAAIMSKLCCCDLRAIASPWCSAQLDIGTPTSACKVYASSTTRSGRPSPSKWSWLNKRTGIANLKLSIQTVMSSCLASDLDTAVTGLIGRYHPVKRVLTILLARPSSPRLHSPTHQRQCARTATVQNRAGPLSQPK